MTGAAASPADAPGVPAEAPAPAPVQPRVSRRRELFGALLVYLMLTFLFTEAKWQKDPTANGLPVLAAWAYAVYA